MTNSFVLFKGFLTSDIYDPSSFMFHTLGEFVYHDCDNSVVELLDLWCSKHFILELLDLYPNA